METSRDIPYDKAVCADCGAIFHKGLLVGDESFKGKWQPLTGMQIMARSIDDELLS